MPQLGCSLLVVFWALLSVFSLILEVIRFLHRLNRGFVGDFDVTSQSF